MSRQKRIPPVSRPSIAVVADGYTEAWYLNMLKRNERHIRIAIKPEIQSKKTLQDQFEFVCDLADKEYSKVFWIVDLDTIIKETREIGQHQLSPMSSFISYRQKLKDEYSNVTVIINNPCLEFWFLLHFERTGRVFDSCAKAVNQLKKHLPDYEKTQRYFTKQNDDIYLKLKPYLNTAIENASLLGNFDNNSPYKAMCEMESFFFCEELEEFFKKNSL